MGRLSRADRAGHSAARNRGELTPEEARIFHLKALGFSSEEIAKPRGSSVNSVDKVMSRLKQKFRALIGAKGVENTGRSQVVPGIYHHSPHATSTDTEIAE